MPAEFAIAIVGSGPAGMSAAAHAARTGTPHILLERAAHLSDTIFKYQKRKHVMATPEMLPLRSDLAFKAFDFQIRNFLKQSCVRALTEISSILIPPNS